eukprot:9014081-Heterocapsa_arctica.AAC.1
MISLRIALTSGSAQPSRPHWTPDKWRTDGHGKEQLSALHIGQPKATGAAAAGTKEVCRQFQTKGTCSFGDACRFLHAGAKAAPAAKAARKAPGA